MDKNLLFCLFIIFHPFIAIYVGILLIFLDYWIPEKKRERLLKRKFKYKNVVEASKELNNESHN